MALRGILKFRNADSTADLNRRFFKALGKGVLDSSSTGLATQYVIPVPSVLQIAVNPFSAVSADGMLVAHDGPSVPLTVTAGITQYIVLRAKYNTSTAPTTSLEVLSAAAYAVDPDRTQIYLGQPIDYLIVLAKITLGGAATEVFQADIDLSENHVVNTVGRFFIRGEVPSLATLNTYSADPNRLVDGDVYLAVAEKQLYRWDSGTSTWDALTDGQLATDLYNHINDPADAHDASAISFVPTGSIGASDVQAALVEVNTEKVAKTGDSMTGALNIAASLPGSVALDVTNSAAGSGEAIRANGFIAIKATGTGTGASIEVNNSGTGAGLDVTGGASAPGIIAFGNLGSNAGHFSGAGAGAGVLATGGPANGVGLVAVGDAGAVTGAALTSASGIVAKGGSTDGMGILALGANSSTFTGPDRAGLEAVGGNSPSDVLPAGTAAYVKGGTAFTGAGAAGGNGGHALTAVGGDGSTVAPFRNAGFGIHATGGYLNTTSSAENSKMGIGVFAQGGGALSGAGLVAGTGLKAQGGIPTGLGIEATGGVGTAGASGASGLLSTGGAAGAAGPVNGIGVEAYGGANAGSTAGGTGVFGFGGVGNLVTGTPIGGVGGVFLGGPPSAVGVVSIGGSVTVNGVGAGNGIQATGGNAAGTGAGAEGGKGIAANGGNSTNAAGGIGGYGVTATGGNAASVYPGGFGVFATGGNSSLGAPGAGGFGVFATGGTISGTGVKGVGGATNGTGVYGTGTGTGFGVVAENGLAIGTGRFRWDDGTQFCAVKTSVQSGFSSATAMQWQTDVIVNNASRVGTDITVPDGTYTISYDFSVTTAAAGTNLQVYLDQTSPALIPVQGRAVLPLVISTVSHHITKTFIIQFGSSTTFNIKMEVAGTTISVSAGQISVTKIHDYV